jgi:quinol monooxygenase YgiN
MTQVTVTARLRAKPGEERRVAGELERLLAPTRREKGCINYDMHRSADDPTLFLFYENWESRADLDRHLESSHIREWFELSKQLLAEPIDIAFWVKH